MAKQDNNVNNRRSPRRNPGTGGGVLQQVFGYPPDNLEPRTNEMIKKSFPVARFFPSTPEFQRGLDLFRIKDAWKEYTELLKENGYSTNNTKDHGIQLAFLADNFPTDSFTNEYGENFLQKMTGLASEGASSLAQIMGAESASEAYNTMQGNLKGSKNPIAKVMASMMGTAGNVAGALKTGLSAIPGIGNATASGINLIDRLAAGARIDFPMVWKSSAFQPSYSMTVRLYNPFPQSEAATKRYIIGPIAAIMLLAVPRASDASTYTWPFLHRIECPGLYELNPGFISNVTVIKGGDQQQISLQNRLGIVDVRIDVGSLYSSMLGGSSKITSVRPSVLGYTRVMGQEDAVTSRIDDNENIGTGSKHDSISKRDVGITNFASDASGKYINSKSVSIGTGSKYGKTRGVGRTTRGKKISPKRAATAFGSDTDPKSRVSAAAKALADELKKLDPFA